METLSRYVAVLTIAALVLTGPPLSNASREAVAEEVERLVFATGPDGVSFEISYVEGLAPVMRVILFDRVHEVPLSDGEVDALESFVEEQGPIRLSTEQLQEFQLRVQEVTEALDPSTPCSPEDYDACYTQGVEECDGGEISGGLGGGIGTRIAPRTFGGGVFGGVFGIIAMRFLTCIAPVSLGCQIGCRDLGGPGCSPIGSCYASCPENTQPTRQLCRIDGVLGTCCTWNGPWPGDDNCVPPAVCYDNICLGCPDYTIPGQGSCEANTHVGCGACCIPQ